MTERRVKLRIHGRVQGVFFRESTRQEADRAGVRGWVRNCSDGTVEALLEGSSEAVEAVVAFCRRGPPAAEVARVDVTEERPSGDLVRFTVERG